MERKNIIIIVIVALAVITVGYAITSTIGNNAGGGDMGNLGTTPFKTDFMEGVFVGDGVKLVNESEKFMHSYEDSKHNITYNISTVDNSTALMDIYYVQGVMNPEHRSYNGNDWNIYFSQAIQGNNTNDTMSIIICQSQGKKQGYLIYMIIDSKSDVNTSALNVYGSAFKNFVEPLLESITLKESNDVPAIHDEFGLTADQFAEQMKLIQQYKAGNTSALQQSSG